jgi:hypothetical protein
VASLTPMESTATSNQPPASARASQILLCRHGGAGSRGAVRRTCRAYSHSSGESRVRSTGRSASDMRLLAIQGG